MINDICPECDEPAFGLPKPETFGFNTKIPYIVLEDILTRRCTNCATIEVAIPSVVKLHRRLVCMFTTSPARLNGPEICFLRKYLGWTAAEMGRAFSVTPETISRWENMRQPMGATAERLLRIVAYQKEQSGVFPLDKLLYFAEEQRTRVPRTFVYSIKDADWYEIVDLNTQQGNNT